MNALDEQFNKLEKLLPSKEKTKLIESMFHSSIWNKLDTNQKIRLLELLEIDLANQENRKPNKIEVWQKLPSIACASFPFSNSIKISKHHLETMGTKSNAKFYCAIKHEHEHFNQYYDSISAKKDIKTEEIRANLNSLIPYSRETATKYIEYRLQPIEYYAHKISEEKTQEVFERLISEFGPDEGFEKWLQEEVVPLDLLVQLYNEENNTSFSFEELYQKIFSSRIEKYQK